MKICILVMPKSPLYTRKKFQQILQVNENSVEKYQTSILQNSVVTNISCIPFYN